jgi:hypothetical protein
MKCHELLICPKYCDVFGVTGYKYVSNAPESRSTDGEDENDRNSEEIRSVRDRTRRRADRQGSPNFKLS